MRVKGISSYSSCKLFNVYPIATSYFSREATSDNIVNSSWNFCVKTTYHVRKIHVACNNKTSPLAKRSITPRHELFVDKQPCFRYTSSRDESTKSSAVIDNENKNDDPENSQLLVAEKTSLPTDTIPVAPRSKKLASIIRDGVVLLNQTAAKIQSNANASKSLFTSPEDKSEPNAKQLSEENRIFETAQQCLEDLCRKDPSFPLMAGDEPVLLLSVKVNPSFTHADLFWALPYCVLTTKELNNKEREYLMEKMSERMDGPPGKILLKRMYGVLSNYYPPKIRFKAAPPILVEQVLYDLKE